MKSPRFVTVRFESLIWWNAESSEVPFYLEKIDREMNSSTEKVIVVGNLLWEESYQSSDDLVNFLSQCQTRQVDVIVFANSSVQYDEIVNVLKNHGCKVVFLDYFLYRIYQEIIIKKVNPINLFWNRSAENFLVLTGKSQPLNRAPLLWHLDQKQLLDRAIWSLYVPESDWDCTVESLVSQGATTLEATEFLSFRKRLPDDARPIFWPNGGSHYSGIPYDLSMYSRSRFRIISETSFKKFKKFPIAWITEKTWLTIANRCPFIMAGQPGTLDFLESLGFKTFREYLLDPDYDNLKDPKERLLAIVKNAEYWINDKRFDQEIHQDVEHNFHHFVTLGEKIKQEMLDILRQINLDSELDQIIITEDLIGKSQGVK